MEQDKRTFIITRGVRGSIGPQGPAGSIGPQGVPGVNSWDGIPDKPPVIAAGATQQEARDAIGLGSAATMSASSFATAAQGGKADTALQPNAGLAAIDSAASKTITSLGVSPEVFGAIGDGVADDTDAIQSALNIGRTVWLKSGAVYLVSRPLLMQPNQVLEGAGATIKRAPQSTTTTTSPIGNNTHFTFTTLPGDGAKFAVGQRVFAYRGNAEWTDSPQIVGIAGDVITTDVKFQFYAGGSTASTASIGTTWDVINAFTNCTIRDVIFDGNSSNWIRARWETCAEIGISGHNVTIDNCTIYNAPGEGILFHGGYPPNQLSAAKVINYRCYNANGNPIHLSGCVGARISGLYVDGANLDDNVGHQDGCVAFSNAVTDVKITNFYLRNGKHGIGGMRASDSSHVTISTGEIRNARVSAISSITSGNGWFSNVLISDVKIYDSYKIEISKANLTNNLYPSNWVLSNLSLVNTVISLKNVMQLSVTGCNLSNQSGGASILAEGGDMNIVGNTINGGEYGIMVKAGARCSAFSNRLVNQSTCAVHTIDNAGNNSYFSNNSIMITEGFTPNGAYTAANLSNGSILNGNLVDIGAATTSMGVVMCPNGADGVRAATITNNIILSSSAHSSIRMYGGSKNNTVTGNCTKQAIVNGGGASNIVTNNQIVL